MNFKKKIAFAFWFLIFLAKISKVKEIQGPISSSEQADEFNYEENNIEKVSKIDISTLTVIKEGDSLIVSSRFKNETLIWLHDIFDPPDGYWDMFYASNSPVNPGTRVVMPAAPLRRSYAGEEEKEVNAWFRLKQVKNFDSVYSDDSILITYPDLFESLESLHRLIRKELSLLPRGYLLSIGGFGQGGVMALAAFLTFPLPLSAVFCFDGFLPSKIKPENPRENVYMIHGTQNQIIPIDFARRSAEGINAEFVEVEGKHWLSRKKINIMEEILMVKAKESEKLAKEKEEQTDEELEAIYERNEKEREAKSNQEL